MKSSDVQLHMRVVPSQKTAGIHGLETSLVWRAATGRGQFFLYVIKMTGVSFGLSDVDRNHAAVDFFTADDFEPYQG